LLVLGSTFQDQILPHLILIPRGCGCGPILAPPVVPRHRLPEPGLAVLLARTPRREPEHP
jgi:hypothetical protein